MRWHDFLWLIQVWMFYLFCVYYLCWLCLCLLECSQLHSLCYLVYFYVIIYCQNAVGYLSGGGNVVLSMTVYMRFTCGLHAVTWFSLAHPDTNKWEATLHCCPAVLPPIQRIRQNTTQIITPVTLVPWPFKDWFKGRHHLVRRGSCCHWPFVVLRYFHGECSVFYFILNGRFLYFIFLYRPIHVCQSWMK